jgi:hypothetical protein
LKSQPAGTIPGSFFVIDGEYRTVWLLRSILVNG